MSQGNICNYCRHWESDHDEHGECKFMWKGSGCDCLKFELFVDEKVKKAQANPELWNFLTELQRKVSLKVLIFGFLFLAIPNFALAQVSVSQEFVDDAAKAFSLVVEQRDAIEKMKTENADLRKLVEQIEKSQRTPCTISADKVKSDLVFWLAQLETDDPVRKKEVQKILKDTRKQGKKMLMSQCGFTNESQLLGWLKVVVPFGVGLLF